MPGVLKIIHLRLQWRQKKIQRSGRGGNADTIDDSESNQQSTNDVNWRGGGATGRRHDKGQTNNNQTDYAEGGLDGDDDDEDNNDDDNDRAAMTTTAAAATTTTTMADAVGGGVATTG